MKLKGHLSISRCSDRTIRVSIEDQLSGIEIVEVIVSPEGFGNAVTGLGCVECELETGALDKVGKIREHKILEVEFASSYDREKDGARAKKALTPFETDGWIGRVDDLFNGHRRVKNKPNAFIVHFVRWVETPAQPKSTNRKEP